MNNIISQNQEKIKNSQRYIPHLLETRFYAVKTYRSGNSVSYVCRRYNISKASLMRWNKKFDGSIDSLYDDLIKQMKKYLYRSNRLPMQTLNWLSPIEKRKEISEKLIDLKEN